jgi:hypothetical protein
MLTAQQSFQLISRHLTPPWRFSEIRSIFNVSPRQAISLKQVIAEVENQQCLIFGSVRDISLLRDFSGGDTISATVLEHLWGENLPFRATLVSFTNFVSAHGAAVKYLSSDWKTVGIAMPTTQLLSFPGVVCLACVRR